MISNPRLLSYTCIAKGTVILAEYISKEEAGLEETALRCIENTPPHHSIFSHTVRKKTYTFAIDDSFVFFAISDETMEKSDTFWLLNRLRTAVEDLVGTDAINNPTPNCLQAKFDPIFTEVIGVIDFELDMDLVGSPRSVARESRNPSIDSSKGGRRTALIPLLGKPLKALKKKRVLLHTEEGSDDTIKEVSENGGNNNNGGVLRKELRNGLLTDHQSQSLKAKQIWRKHVWVVLLFDFCICAVLFGIWLWVCEGFQCVDG